MLWTQVAGWFVLGFVVAAVFLYAPVIAKAYWVKAQAILTMKQSNANLRESTEIFKEVALVRKDFGEALNKQLEMAKEYGALQDKYLSSLNDYKTLGEEVLEERKEHGELLRKYEELLKDHKALLLRTGGGSEGTA